MGEILSRFHAAHKERRARMNGMPPRLVRPPVHIEVTDSDEPVSLPIIQTLPRVIGFNRVMRVVSDHYGLSVRDFLGKSRKWSICKPRMVAMYLCRTVIRVDGGPPSYPLIGERFKKDHTSVLHGVQTIEDRLAVEPELAATINMLRAVIVSPTSRALDS